MTEFPYFLFLDMVGDGGGTPDWLPMECCGEGGTREEDDGEAEGARSCPPPSPAVIDTSSYVSCSSSLHNTKFKVQKSMIIIILLGNYHPWSVP